MGKKRVALVGEPTAKPLAEPVKPEAPVVKVKVVKKTKKIARPAKKRGAAYLEALQKIDRHQFYSPSEAIKLLKSVSVSQFNGSVDAHLVVLETGLKGEVVFPHPTGKNPIIRIADDKLIAELEQGLPAGRQGKINFSYLIATPAMMPKLLKFAKILGPKGLMPNPKAGTITDKPEEVAKSLANKTLFRTETKFPLIHIVIGKVNDNQENLIANFKALIAAVGPKNIKKAVIVPTMGPGIKIDLTEIKPT